jgi:hypothetical protein
LISRHLGLSATLRALRKLENCWGPRASLNIRDSISLRLQDLHRFGVSDMAKALNTMPAYQGWTHDLRTFPPKTRQLASDRTEQPPLHCSPSINSSPRPHYDFTHFLRAG